jgi:hypothetical protein
MPPCFSGSSLGQRALHGPGSAFAVAGRGCATTGLRRGGRRVAVPRRPLTAAGGWRRSRPGSGRLAFLSALAGMGPLWRWGLLQRPVAANGIRYGCLWRRAACQVGVGRVGLCSRVGVVRWVAGRWARPGWRRAIPVCRRSTRPTGQHGAGPPPRLVFRLRRCRGPGRRAEQPAGIVRSGMVPSSGRRRAGGECRAATATAPRGRPR